MRVTWAALTVLCLLAMGLLLGALSWCIIDQPTWHQATGWARDAALLLALFALINTALPSLVAMLVEEDEPQ